MSESPYLITVEGELDDLTVTAFADMSIERGAGVTVLHTHDLDQAALDGVLDRLRLVGAPLVELKRSSQVS